MTMTSAVRRAVSRVTAGQAVPAPGGLVLVQASRPRCPAVRGGGAARRQRHHGCVKGSPPLSVRAQWTQARSAGSSSSGPFLAILPVLRCLLAPPARTTSVATLKGR